MTRLARWIVTLLAVAGLGAIGAGLWLLQAGIGTRTPPGAVEVAAARRLRALAIPRAAVARTNPVPADPATLAEGMAHFADHCAGCHANDGSGNTEMGRGLYPRAPDMRLEATQALSDGTLFYIIENGVKLTGMPAWGTGSDEGERATWKLVHFVRHLPALTESEQLEMEALNPKSGDEWRQEDEIKRFLEGEGDVPPDPGQAQPPHHH